MNNKDDLEIIKQAIPITDLAKELGLEIRGRQARCYNGQAHKNNDRNFSLGLNIKANRYKCFACGESGSVIDLYAKINKIEIGQAIRELKERLGLSQSGIKASHKPLESHETQKTTQGTQGDGKKANDEANDEDLNLFSDIYEDFYFYCIQPKPETGLDEESEDYLGKRGLTSRALSRFLLFSVWDYQKTDKYLKDTFKLDDLKRAGIVSKEGGNLIFYRHKIIVPFIEGGRIVFLQGRRPDKGEPKYLHIARPIPLYNADTLLDAEKGERVYITEGVFDAMMIEQDGYRAVGLLGVNGFKPEWVKLFKGLDVVLSLDNDGAGQKGTQDIAGLFKFNGQGVDTITLPEGIKDITDYYLSL